MEWTFAGTGRRSFGRRRMAPRVGIVDRKPYVRTFLAEMFEDFGFIPECWLDASELFPSLNNVEPDLVVIVVSDDAESTDDILKVLATARFRGRIMLMGSLAGPRSQAPSGLANSSGLRCFRCLGRPSARAS
jgi:hypothetical protein